MGLIRFETADRADRTRIGEGLTRPARAAGRLDVEDGREYWLCHEDGCADCGAAFAAGEAFYFDPDAGSVYCGACGDSRRED